MTMHCPSALHFSLTTTVALHIKHAFVIERDEEVLILASFLQIIYKCSRFIFITTAEEPFSSRPTKTLNI